MSAVQPTPRQLARSIRHLVVPRYAVTLPILLQMQPSGSSRLAILGLYNSGSTILAGMLHRLGVNMGSPFWKNSRDSHAENFYEPLTLSVQLRHWWNEPLLVERTPAGSRSHFLRAWVEREQSQRPGPVGAKHPLLTLCAAELVSAWGPDTQLIWACRPFADSLRGLQRRGWLGAFAPAVQQRLWDALVAMDKSQLRLVRFDWDKIMADPPAAARRLASIARLDATEHQLRQAAEFVRAPTQPIAQVA